MNIVRTLKGRFAAVIIGIVLAFLSLILIFIIYFTKLSDAISDLYVLDSYYFVKVLAPESTMPSINDLLLQSGIVIWMVVTLSISTSLPIFFILRDYYKMNSIRTIMRLPIPKTFYYLDKLLPPVILNSVLWAMQFVFFSQAERVYLSEVPDVKIPADIPVMFWSSAPANNLCPIESPTNMLVVISFLILLPAVVILFTLAQRSRIRGIFSGLVAICGGFVALSYLMEFPFSLWIVPAAAVIVIISGIWHVNRIQIV